MGQSLGADETEEHESFGSRMVGALAGMCIGVVLFLVSPVVLGLNEFNFVNNQAVLWTVHDKAIEANCAAEEGHAGKPIWLKGCPVAELHDFAGGLHRAVKGVFKEGTLLRGVKLSAQSEIYQWVESERCNTKKDAIGGGKTKKCKYTYAERWISAPVSFKGPNPDNLQNRGEIRGIAALKFMAPEYSAKIGKKEFYGLNNVLMGVLNEQLTLQLKPGIATGTDIQGLRVADASADELLFGTGSFLFPKIGDVKTKFMLTGGRVGTTPLSVVGQQKGGPPEAKLECWDTGKKGAMAKVCWGFLGQFDLGQMEEKKHGENIKFTWILRLVGWLMMFIGLNLIFGPIALLPDLIPCIGPRIGDVVGCALCCGSLLVSSALSLVVIGIAWCMARPLIGGLMLGGGALLITGAVALHIHSKQQRGEDAKLKEPAEASGAYGAAVAPPYQPYQLPAVAMPYQPPVVAVVVAQPVAAAPIMLPVQCPEGVGPRQLVQVAHPVTGAPMNVAVPDGVAPGMVFQVQC